MPFRDELILKITNQNDADSASLHFGGSGAGAIYLIQPSVTYLYLSVPKATGSIRDNKVIRQAMAKSSSSVLSVKDCGISNLSCAVVNNNVFPVPGAGSFSGWLCYKNEKEH